MYKLMIIIALFLNGCASDFINQNIKQDNRIKSIQTKQVNDNYTTLQGYIFTNNSKISIKFNQVTPELINEFETRYNLHLERILIVGDYIYSHNSDNIFDLIGLISNEDNVKQIVPLWKKPVKTY